MGHGFDRRSAKHKLLALLLLACLWTASDAQLHKFKSSRNRGGSSKFSLNPLKPLMNLMRQDPMKAAAQRHAPKYLPPPPGMYQQMAQPSRTYSYGVQPYRPYPSHTTRVLPPTTVSFMPPMSAAPSNNILSALVNDHFYGHGQGYGHGHGLHSHNHHSHYSTHNHYRPQASDLQIKAIRIPPKGRRPASQQLDSLNLADSVVRQLLDLQSGSQQSEHQHQQSGGNSFPSVLVIEDPDGVSSSSAAGESMYESHQPQQKLVFSPPVHAELASDASTDGSGQASSGNPEVFVIVSKNKGKSSSYFGGAEDKSKASEQGVGSSAPKLKKYKITSAYDENGGRQVWIIKR